MPNTWLYSTATALGLPQDKQSLNAKYLALFDNPASVKMKCNTWFKCQILGFIHDSFLIQ